MDDDIIHRYKKIAIIGVCLCAFFALATIWIPVYLDYYDENVYFQDYLSGNIWEYPKIIDNKDSISYILLQNVTNTPNKKEVILIGASTTRYGIVKNYSLNNGYTLYNRAVFDGPFGYKLMLNYFTLRANKGLDPEDIVIFHIYYASFADYQNNHESMKLKMENFGSYIIDDDGNISGSLGELHKHYLENIIMYKTFMSTIDYSYDKLIDCLSNVFSEINESSMRISYDELYSFEDSLTKGTKYPNEYTDKFKNLLIETSNMSKVVVVNLYAPSWMRDNPTEHEYEKWLNESLIPFLDENDICYLDFSRSIPDNEFVDHAHLNKQGRENYTRQFDMTFKNLSIFKEI